MDLEEGSDYGAEVDDLSSQDDELIVDDDSNFGENLAPLQ